MSISPLAMQAKQVIENAWLTGPSYDLATQAAKALESAQLLQSPELVTEVAEAAVSAAETAVRELRRASEENARLRAENERLRAERHTTNEALADVTVALRAAEAAPGDTLAAWLYQRYVPVAGALAWESLSDGDRAYWEHQARATRRAVERGGFKPAGAGSDGLRSCCAGPSCTCTSSSPQDDEYIPPTQISEDVTPQVEKLRALLAGQRAALEDPHDSPLHHTYRLGRDLPQMGGA